MMKIFLIGLTLFFIPMTASANCQLTGAACSIFDTKPSIDTQIIKNRRIEVNNDVSKKNIKKGKVIKNKKRQKQVLP